MLRAERSIVVIKGAAAPEWFLIADEIQKDTASHAYEWLLHTQATNTVDIGSDPATIQGVQSRMHVWFAHPRPPALDLTVSPWMHDGEDPSTLRLVARTQATEGRYMVALLPLVNSVNAPEGTVAQAGRATQLRLDWGTVEDVAVFNPTDSSRTISGLETDGRMAIVRLAGKEVAAYLLAEGTVLRHATLDLVAFTNGDASAALSGNELHLSRADVVFQAYGPQVTRVVGPAGALQFVRQGAWVQSPTASDALPGGPAPAPTAIRLDCAPHPSSVRAAIYDVRGRLVQSLDQRALDASGRAFVWDRATAAGQRAAAGVYFVRVRACGRESRQRIVLVP
jgi:hypothetical protein